MCILSFLSIVILVVENDLLHWAVYAGLKEFNKVDMFKASNIIGMYYTEKIDESSMTRGVPCLYLICRRKTMVMSMK